MYRILWQCGTIDDFLLYALCLNLYKLFTKLFFALLTLISYKMKLQDAKKLPRQISLPRDRVMQADKSRGGR